MYYKAVTRTCDFHSSESLMFIYCRSKLVATKLTAL